MRKLLLGLVLLAGCTETGAMKTAADYQAESCASYGLTKGTPEFAQCMLAQEQMRLGRAQTMIGGGLGLMSLGRPYSLNGTTTCYQQGPYTTCQ